MTSEPTLSPNFVKARSAEALRALCIKNNIARNESFKYDIVFDGKEWYAWFYSDAAQEIIEGNAKRMTTASRGQSDVTQ